MPVADHPLRAKLSTGKPIAGTWSLIPHPQAVATLAAAGFDFVLLDAEHGSYDFATLDAAIVACERGGASPLVRAPGADGFFIQRALDCGADGIVVPQIADGDAASRAVAMAHFAPRGTRGYNPYTRAGNFGIEPRAKLRDGYPFTGVLVETPAAAQSLERIAALPDLDLVYLGVYDYSVALGIPGQVDDARVQSFVEHATRIVRDAGKAVGTTAMSASQAERLLRIGVNVLLYGTDTWMLGNSTRDGLAMYERAKSAR
ncbi:MAG TPA: aldolase/citrate lyase family protein [Casimicrobiaceae bacterium]|nr:aldolase/citrate lyase family protein [Casimicrobiaceae bacterium]